jgi:hypothetical protein
MEPTWIMRAKKQYYNLIHIHVLDGLLYSLAHLPYLGSPPAGMLCVPGFGSCESLSSLCHTRLVMLPINEET